MAAGLADSGLIEAWNGAAWSIVPSPSPGTGSGLTPVSCASITFCASVGSYATACRARAATRGGQLDLVSVGVVAGISDGFQVAVGSGSFTVPPLARTAIAMHD